MLQDVLPGQNLEHRCRSGVVERLDVERLGVIGNVLTET